MTPERFERIREVFEGAAQRTAPEREHWLCAECEGDDELLQEVRLLLLHDRLENDPLEAGLPEILDKLGESVSERAENGHAQLETFIPNSVPDLCGQTIGPYTILQQIGEGGMGTVYLADQRSPVKRRVAIKVIKPGFDSKEVIARFEAERQALALMDHPHIAKVLDAGTTDAGHPYFAMELVNGVPITNYCNDNHLDLDARIELFFQVCHAIQHAHQKGIIHRDIKPSNILVSENNDQPYPKVIDFGVAKATGQRLTDQTLFTAHGQIVGTVEYMSPEQAGMIHVDIDTRSDIYSLGVLLYELLTGTTPFTKEQLRGQGIAEMLKTIREKDPPKPSTRMSETGRHAASSISRKNFDPAKLSRMLQGDLDWIVMKALEKDRSRRYETANGLAADLKRHLKGDPVEASPPSTTYRLKKLARKYRGVLIAGSVISVLLIVATIVSGVLAYRATVAEKNATENENLANQRLVELQTEKDRTVEALNLANTERQRAEQQEAIAETSERKTRRLLYRSDMREAVKAFENHETARLRDLLLRHVPTAGQEDNRDLVWNHLWNELHSAQHQLFQGSAVHQMDLSADGRILMTRGANRLFYFWDTQTGQQVGMLELPTWTDQQVRLSPDGKKIVHAGYAQHDPVILDRVTLEIIGKIPVQSGRPESIAWSPDGSQIATTSMEGTRVAIYSVEERTTEKQWTFAKGAQGENLVISPDGRFLAHGSAHSIEVRLVDVETGEQTVFTRPKAGHSSEAMGVICFSPDSRFLATCGNGGVELWDLKSREQVAAFKNDSVYWCDIAWQPNSEALYVCGGNQLLQLSGRDLTLQRRLSGHVGRLTHVRVTPEEGQLISSSIDGTVHIRQTQEQPHFDQPFSHAEFLKNGSLLAATKKQDILRVSPDETVEATRVHTTHRIAYSSLRDDERIIAFYYGDGVVSLWDLENGVELHADLGRKKDSYTSIVHSLAFQPHGKLIAISAWDGTYLLDSEDYSYRGRFDSYRTHGLAFAPDGQHFAVGHGDRADTNQTLRIYSIDSPNPVSILHATSGDFRAVAFSDDGRWVASGGSEQVLRLSQWQKQGEEIQLTGHQAAITALAFSPDGSFLISGDLNGDVRVWSLHDRELIAALSLFDRQINHIDFSGDGNRVAIASDAGMKILDARRSDSFDTQVEMAQLLAQNRSVDYFAAMADREDDPKYYLSAAQHCYWRANEAVESENHELALEYLDRASGFLHESGSMTQESLAEIKIYLDQRVFFTRWGCLVELGKGFEYDRESFQDRNLQLFQFYAQSRYHELNPALKVGLSQFRRELINADSKQSLWAKRLAPFLVHGTGSKHLYYANAVVAFRSQDDTVKVAYRLEEVPEKDSRIILFGTDNSAAHAVMFQPEDFDWLAEEYQLESMTIDVYEASDEFWKGLAGLKQLKNLALKNWTGSNPLAHQSLSQLTNLESLTVDSSFNGFEHLSVLGELPNLRSLTFKESWLSVDNIKVLQKFSKLTTLQLSWSVINDEAMPELAKMKQLEALFIDAATVSETGIQHLAGHPNLRRLDLFEIPLGDAIIGALIDMPQLEYAGLYKTDVTALGVSRLRRANPNCMVMHSDGYLNVGKHFKGEMVVGSAPPETMYFPSINDATKLANELLNQESELSDEQVSQLSNLYFRQPNREVVESIFDGLKERQDFWNRIDWGSIQPKYSTGQGLTPASETLLQQRATTQSSLRLSGTESDFELPEFTMDPAQGVTIEVWARPTTFSMKSEYGDILLHVQAGDDFKTSAKLRFQSDLKWACVTQWLHQDTEKSRKQFMISSSFPNYLSMKHLAITYNNTQVSFFVDGKLINTGEIAAEALSENWELIIGSESIHYGGGQFQGVIDELRVSNTVRYRGEFVPAREFVPDEQTVLLYHFDANPLGVVFDHSARRNHFVPENADFVLLPEKRDASVVKSQKQALPFANFLSELELIDLASLPPVKPMWQYLEAPPHSTEKQTAIRFNGQNSHFSFPEIRLEKNSGITFEAWVKVEGLPRSQWGAAVIDAISLGEPNFPLAIKFLKDATAWAAFLNPPAPFKSAFIRGEIQSTETGPPNDWFHLAVVIDRQQMTIFVDGKRSSVADISTLKLPNVWDVSVGGRYSDQKHIGLIDEVRISDTARYTEDFEPQREFDPIDDPEAETKLLLHFDQNDQNIIFDHSGNNNHIKLGQIEWVDLTSPE